MKLIRNQFMKKIEKSANKIAPGQHSKYDLYYDEGQARGSGNLVRAVSRAHSLNVSIEETDYPFATKTEIKLVRCDFSEPAEHLTFKRTTIDKSKQKESELRLHFEGKPQELSLIQLGRVAINLTEAGNTIASDYIRESSLRTG